MKKQIVLLAACLSFQKGALVTIDSKQADELIADGKALEVRDPSRDNRDHATPPGNEEVIAAALAKALAPIGAQVKALEEKLAATPAEPRTKATNNLGEVPRAAPITGTTGEERVYADKPGLRWARMVKAIAVAKMDNVPVDQVLEDWGYEQIRSVFKRDSERRKAIGAQLRALGQSTQAAGGALVPAEFSSELIPLLRNATAVRKLGARSLPMNASLTIPKQTGAATAAYVGENSPATPSEQTFGTLTLVERKLVVLVPFSNDLIRNAEVDAEMVVRDDALAVMSIKEDSTFMFGTGAQDTPRGIEALAVAGNKYAATASSATAPTLAELRKELGKARRKLRSQNIPMTRCGHIISPAVEEYFTSITDGNGNAVYAEMMQNGKLGTDPVVTTNQIPENGGGSADEKKWFYGDFDQAVIGEAKMQQAEFFPNGVYESGGSALSGISRDQSVLRVIALHDFQLRYPEAFVVITTRMGA